MRPDTGSTRRQPAFLTIAAIALFLARLAGGVISDSHEAGMVDWRSAEEAKAESARTGKPVLLVFLQNRESRCRRFEREMLLDTETRESILRSYLPVRIVDRSADGSGNPAEIALLMQRHHIERFPAFVILYPDGRGPDVLPSYPGKQRTMNFLRRYTLRP